ncbi:hypothetical protein [Blastomonas sp.]|uniref:hypothetical protein n=1 Tax=Blastomonas sp. TaxID=1909299 RepID=UPI00359313FE
MRALRVAAAALVTALLGATPALAGTPYPQNYICPLGGEEFTLESTMSYSTWGQRPDGKPFGSWITPFPLPQCPSNRLIMFDDFTQAELTALERLIADPAYLQIVNAQPLYYAAFWLAERLQRPVEQRANLLMQAVWQSEVPSDARETMLRRFAIFVDAELADDTSAAALGIRAFGANAYRELGEFETAQARLLAVRALLADGANKAIDAETREGVTDYLDRLEPVIARRDTALEPLDFVPEERAISQCVIYRARLTEWERDFCNAPQRAARVNEEMQTFKGGQQGLDPR